MGVLARTFIALGLLFGASAYSASVKITSFYLTDNRGITAELCGQIEGATTGKEIIDITSDPSIKTPGHYTAIPSKSGQFCTVIATTTGQADATIRDELDSVSAKIKK